MKKLIFAFLFCLIPCLCWPVGNMMIAAGKTHGSAAAPAVDCSGATPTGCVERETFDAASACGDGSHTNCVYSWSGTFTTNFDATGLQGTYAAAITSGSIRRDITGAAEYWIGAIVKFDTIGSDADVISIRETGGDNILVFVDWNGTSNIRLRGTGMTSITGPSPTTGQTWYLKLRVKVGTGANAEGQFWSSTDGKTWTDHGTATDGDWMTNADRIRFYAGSATTYDDIRVSPNDFDFTD